MPLSTGMRELKVYLHIQKTKQNRGAFWYLLSDARYCLTNTLLRKNKTERKKENTLALLSLQ